MGKKGSRLLTRAFKKDAVRIAIGKGMPAGSVAQKRYIPQNLLHQGICLGSNESEVQED